MVGLNQVLTDYAFLTNLTAVMAIISIGLIFHALIKKWRVGQFMPGRWGAWWERALSERIGGRVRRAEPRRSEDGSPPGRTPPSGATPAPRR